VAIGVLNEKQLCTNTPSISKQSPFNICAVGVVVVDIVMGVVVVDVVIGVVVVDVVVVVVGVVVVADSDDDGGGDGNVGLKGVGEAEIVDEVIRSHVEFVDLSAKSSEQPQEN